MSTLDLNAACNAMATALQAVTPPTGDHMRRAYGQAPNNAPSTPCAIVMPESGSLVLQPGSYIGAYKIDVWFLIEKAQGDFPRVETRRQKWLPILLHAFDGQMTLGIGAPIRKTYPLGWSFLELMYGGASYDGIKVHFEIATEEPVSLAA